MNVDELLALLQEENIKTFLNEIKYLGTENPTIIAMGGDAYKILSFR